MSAGACRSTGFRSLGAEVTDGYKLPDWNAGTELRSSERTASALNC